MKLEAKQRLLADAEDNASISGPLRRLYTAASAMSTKLEKLDDKRISPSLMNREAISTDTLEDLEDMVQTWTKEIQDESTELLKALKAYRK